jgi:DUF4097 and DUF4098 domain-containing protein YvlB
MGSYPPPPYPPPPGPPYGGDWKYQRRVLKEQARTQRDIARAQRDAYRYQARSLRRSSILGPLLLITVGILFLLVQTGRLQAHALWDWYARFWPILLVGAGVIMLLEWAYDQYMQSDDTQPRYRRRLGGGVFSLLLILGITGIVFSSVRDGNGHSYLLNGLNLNQNNLDEFLGDKHESDQTLSQTFPASAGFTVDNPRGDISISGTSDDNQIHVAVHKEVYTRSDSDADAKAQRLSPTLSTDGGTDLMLSVPAIDGTRADLTITIPASVPTVVTSNHGDIHVSALKAPLQVTANHGNIELSAITGPVIIHINNSDSDVSAHSVSGPVQIQGRGHDTTLSDLTGPVTMSGDFFGTTHFERIRGPIKFHTSRTDLQFARLDGEIDISHADISASEAVGPFTLTAGNRNVTLDRVAGDVTVTNRNGSVDLTSAPPLGNITVENRNGSVDLSLPEQANFAYQLDATNGDIDSDFSDIQIPEGGLQKKTISGSVGKGGPLLHISTSQGDISIKKANVMPLPPLPPMPKITAMPPDARQSMAEAKQEAREAAREGKQEADEAKRDAKQEVDEARREANQAAAEAKREAKEAADEARREAKQQKKDPNQ